MILDIALLTGAQ